jgi:trehalose utilization protein
MNLACLLIALGFLHEPASTAADDPRPVRVVVWDERQPEQKEAYGDMFLGDFLAAELANRPGLEVKSVGQDDPMMGLGPDALENCDVLIWWGHLRHGQVPDELARSIVKRVREGKLALISVHSALSAKPFVLAMAQRTLLDAAEATIDAIPNPASVQWRISTPDMNPLQRKPAVASPLVTVEGTPDGVVVGTVVLPAVSIAAFREDGKPSHVTVRAPRHPIMAGLPQTFDLPQTEMYDEPFQVPPPDVLLFEERWDLGESFRGGLLWHLGRGDVFYFRPGHETYPVFKDQRALKIIENAARWLGGRVHEQSP